MNLKNSTISFMFFLILLPFILVSNFYPFFRYGMFAEPVKAEKKLEKFIIYYTNTQNKKCTFSSENIGFNEGHFQYIIRNHYYNSKGLFLLKNLHKINANPNIKTWELYQTSESIHQTIAKDSTLLYSYEVF